MSLFSVTRIIEEKASPVNGKITVVKSLAFGMHLQVNGLTQSGGVVEDIWKETLKKIAKSKLKVTRCLILGLGGGSAARLVRKTWPKAVITGIDLDPVMVKLGKKYLGLTASKIVIGDAKIFVKNDKGSYELILVDTYLGAVFPKELEEERFLKSVLKLLDKNGCLVFNRLYFVGKRTVAIKFGNKLEKIFGKVEYFYPQANLMFICSR